MADTPAPATPNAPPAPDLSALYGDSGKLVAAPSTASTPAPAPQPSPAAPVDEGLLHSIATSMGIDPEQVVKTAKAIKAHPAATAKAIGSEAASEAEQIAEHPVSTAEQTIAGTRDLITNPDAQEIAKSRMSAPGIGNKVLGAEEYLESGIPMVGGNIVKSHEQAATGNYTGVVGTAIGTVAPLFTDEAGAGLKKVGEHAAETGRNFVASAKEGIQSAATATAPEGSTEAGFAKLGGKQVTSPEPTIEHRVGKTEFGSGSPAPQKMNQVRLVQNGKEVGRVNYTIEGDTASIKAAHVDPSLRGKGYAQQMYLRAADEARDRGAKVLTSDLQGTTSLDAAQVWDKLGQKGHPVEKIPSKAGSPGYRMDLEKPKVEEADPLDQLHGETGKKVSEDSSQRNDPVGFIDPQGKFQKFNQLQGEQYGHEATHADFANNRDLNENEMLADGWARKAGTGSYQVSKLTPATRAAIEKDILQDAPDLRRQPGGLGNIVVDTDKGSAEIPIQDFVEKYNGNLEKAMNAKFIESANAVNSEVAESAQRYNAAKGRSSIDHGKVELPAAGERHALADAYEESAHAPNAPAVKSAYDAMKQETKDQFNHAQNDLGIKYEFTEKDPYDSAEDMMKDVKDNKRLKVYSGSPVQADHPLAEIDKETGQPYNNLFRAVHDTFGHAAGGNDFTEGGEHNAYNAHVQMYSKEAQPAVQNETRNQTNWLFNNKGYREGTQPWRFADQKATVLPEPSKIPSAETTGPIMDVAKTFGEHSFTKNDVKLYTNSNDQAEINAAVDHLVSTGKLKQIDDNHFQANTPAASQWTGTAAEKAKTESAGAINPANGGFDTTGIGTEIFPEARQALDHPPTQEDFAAFEKKNAGILAQYPELRVGWDNASNLPGGHEINLGANGKGAANVAKKLDQRAAWDIGKSEEIPTGGVGLRSEFPNYSMEDRMKDLREEPMSSTKDFEHLSKDVYDHLEPDERDYLKGNKTLQRNVMKQYHSIAPSVAETTNAMQAGAALGGWWRRYMDVFHTLAEGGKQTPQGIPLYHYTGGDFESFDPMIGGAHGDFGTHLGTVEQANSRGYNTATDPSDTANIRPVYANIKNPVRLEDYGTFRPDDVSAQLQDNGIISNTEARKILETPNGSEVNPEKLRDLLEQKGYDGIVYLNRAENVSKEALNDPNSMTVDDEDFLSKHPDARGNDSYIALRPEQIQPKYSAELLANTVGPSHAEVLKQWHAAVSGNKSVEDANNLAWHSYADWLDAGKPTDRKSINDIIKKNAAQPEGSEKKGNAAISDTLDKKGRVISPGLDTNKLYNLVNSPEMRGERPFGGDVFRDDAKNPLMGPTEGARKIPSMGATVAGKGNLNRLVIDAHIRDFYGHKNSGGPAAQYIADSAHLRQAAEALGLKGGEGQEQLWGTVLGLKTLLKEGLTPEEAGNKLNADVINKIGKDYAEVIANDPEITRLGGVLDRLKERYGIGRGSAGISGANRQASGSDASEGGPAGGEAPTDTTQLAKTAERIRGQISESKIKKPAAEEPEDTSFNFGANVAPTPPKKKPGSFNALDLIRGLDALKKPAKK